ncbi:MAG: isoprenylcysteine carboxylmethyltransferase family protein [Methylomonas sp.]|jgi:protein-S-isoprenylcysteine O-methyltransferase Ste14|uniref:methyltransferase family protein n=1 Tax=Methylomonas sp. TaxID=418 RepID=UPI0025E53DC5|nr:isoprenylcysteine carboxylmethyltransferase family protein [Methylomonas sp.]MCK9608889.1 isoprenylcysteine carboxylmethyltransferase family protein [Methylomonas sp.]
MSAKIACDLRYPNPSIQNHSDVRLFLGLKVLLFTLLIPGTVILYFPYSMVLGSATGLHIASLLLALPAGVFILVGLAIYLRCAWDFAVDGLGTPAPIDPPKHLVISGLYRRSRNPMYQGVLLLLLAECLLFPHAGLWIYVGSIALVFQTFVVFYEEPALRKRFGTAYADYCRQVPRWGFAVRDSSSK